MNDLTLEDILEIRTALDPINPIPVQVFQVTEHFTPDSHLSRLEVHAVTHAINLVRLRAIEEHHRKIFPAERGFHWDERSGDIFWVHQGSSAYIVILAEKNLNAVIFRYTVKWVEKGL